jgi:hypothetical protein
MAQHDYDIANQSGSSFRADLNNALDAIVSNNSGSSEPSTTFAYEWWIDTSNNLLKLRNSANNAWITIPISITADNSTPAGLTINGNLVTTGTIDINGQEFILDADADTSITSDTDDQIDIKVGNVDVLTLTNSHLVLKGTTPKITIGDGGEEDTALVFDGNAQDFYIALDDSEDMLTIGVGATVGSSRALLIDSSQRVGLNGLNPSNYWTSADDLVLGGTTSATNYGLSIVGATNSAGSIYFADGTSGADRYRGIISYNHSTDSFDFHTNATYHLSIDSSGRLGIGTTSPSAPIHIKKDASETNLIIQSNVGGSGSNIGGRLRLQLGAQTNTGSGAADTQAGDTLGQIMFEGQGTDYAYQGGNIICKVETGDGDDGRSNQGTFMSFETINVGSVSPAEAMRITQAGALLIGKTADNLTDSGFTLKKRTASGHAQITCVGTGSSSVETYYIYDSSNSEYEFFVSYHGTVYYRALSSLSDERKKDNIKDITLGLDAVKELRPVSFDWKNDKGNDQLGFIAQEVETTSLKQLVSTYKDENIEDCKSLNKEQMIPVLVKAIQELEARVQTLEA